MKARSLLPRRWREALRPTAEAAATLSPRRSARAWSLEALEPRVLLSADPVLGAVHLALAPDAALADPLDQAYSAPQPTMHALAANVQAGPTILTGNYTDASGFSTAALHISGAVGINVTGSLGLGGNNTNFIAGNSSATTDTLTLAATGNISIHSAISTGNAGGDLLSSLVITSAQNVTFDQDVTVNGNLTIDATGIVTFSHGITIGTGGSLTIRGATQLVLSGPVALQQGAAISAGNILLAADEIDFLGLASEQITGTGAVTLRPANVATSMAIFSPAGAATSGVLNLESTEMAAFAAGFSGFTFGYVSGGHALNGAGAVLVGASTSPDSLAMQDGVSIFGGSITVTDYSDRNARPPSRFARWT
ncbi:MAG: LEPR-XLL domain-containing protein [Burkholderiales bacterium]|nr:LEPR-XLL domain-containing protein [Burkholderiales bacterium]